MKIILSASVLIIPLIFAGCITQFVPETKEDPNLLVVEGLITDQPEANIVKLSKSMPLGKMATVKPLTGCTVSLKDDSGNTFMLTESETSGTYLTDPATFQGVVGRRYTLHINTNNATATHYSYESVPMEMRAVPAIDSLYYEKVVVREKTGSSGPQDACQVYLNTHDPQGKCRYYRWNYTETWKFEVPYMVTNSICWITSDSKEIIIKNTTGLSEDRVTRFPLKFISNETDRLNMRYSILVNQYSVSEDELTYWRELQTISQKVGGLYDIIPSSVPGNIFCIENPGEQVLGYFSVSARTSKRIYIDETFRGLRNFYKECPADTLPGNAIIQGLNVWVWIILQSHEYIIITYDHRCADCTVRGTTTKPEFWEDYK